MAAMIEKPSTAEAAIPVALPPPTTDPEKALEAQNTSDTPPIDTNLVTWATDDPEHPKNWSQKRKWALTLLLSCSGTVCLTSSTMLAPALPTIANDFHISQASANMAMSIFVLAFAFGPMLVAPFAEVFGRRNIWLIGSTWYVVWNLACGFTDGHGLLLAARLFAGLGSSVEFVVNSPVLGDIWPPEQRGFSFALSTFLPLLGPAIGPLLGGIMTSTIGWRWCFWILSAVDLGLMFLGLFIFKETYPLLLLRRRAAKLTKETGIQHYTDLGARIEPLHSKITKAVARPTRLLATQPIIQLMSLFLAFNYGTLFFVLTNYSTLWTTRYHETVFHSSLHYLAIVTGYTIGSQGGARITDRLWQHLKTKRGGETAPEFRVPLMIPGNFFIFAGLIWFGWAAEKLAPWPVVDLGVMMFGCGITLSTQSMQQYVMESFPDFVASASAASQFLRGICGFGFPLFAPMLYRTLGYGWGNTTLALVFFTLSATSPLILWFYGPKLRAKGGPER